MGNLYLRPVVLRVGTAVALYSGMTTQPHDEIGRLTVEVREFGQGLCDYVLVDDDEVEVAIVTAWCDDSNMALAIAVNLAARWNVFETLKKDVDAAGCK